MGAKLSKENLATLLYSVQKAKREVDIEQWSADWGSGCGAVSNDRETEWSSSPIFVPFRRPFFSKMLEVGGHKKLIAKYT